MSDFERKGEFPNPAKRTVSQDFYPLIFRAPDWHAEVFLNMASISGIYSIRIKTYELGACIGYMKKT